MKTTQFLAIALVIFSVSVGRAQVRDLEFGVKGGGTFTYGYTNIPARTVGTVQVPELKNNNNGIGYGYSGGLWGRKNFRTFFVQAEVTYNRFVLKQKADALVDINASSSLANALPISVQPGLINASLNVTSESVLEAIDVPILIGKRWLGGRLRGYVGPNFIFVQKATASRITSGQINGNITVGFPQTTIPPTSSTTNLLNRYEAQDLEVRDFTYALELGVGFTPVSFLDIDARFALPVGGVYKDKGITGILGIATVSLGFRVF